MAVGFNVFIVLGLLWGVFVSPLGLPSLGHAMALGVLVAGVVHGGVLAYASRRLMPIRWAIPRWNAEARTFLKRFALASVGGGMLQGMTLTNGIFASFLVPGSLSQLFFADRLVQFPLSIIGISLSTALLPALSRAVQRKQRAQVHALHDRALRIGLLLMVPAASGLYLLAPSLLSTLFQRGAFTASHVAHTASVLQMAALGLPAAIVSRIWSTLFFAHQDTHTPAIATGCALGTHIALCVMLVPTLGAPGITLSFSLAFWVQTGILMLCLWRRGWIRMLLPAPSFLIKLGVCCIVMMVALGIADLFLEGHPVYFLAKVGDLSLRIGIGFSAWMGSSLGLGLIPKEDIKTVINRYLRRSYQ